jgi:hypothetical protein
MNLNESRDIRSNFRMLWGLGISKDDLNVISSPLISCLLKRRTRGNMEVHLLSTQILEESGMKDD